MLLMLFARNNNNNNNVSDDVKLYRVWTVIGNEAFVVVWLELTNKYYNILRRLHRKQP